MEKVRNLRVEMVAVYSPGVLPLSKILVGKCGVDLMSTFDFATNNAGENRSEFQHGHAEVDGKEVIILSLAFDERRINLGIEGTSDEADEIVEKVTSILADNMAEGTVWIDPIVITHATVCTVSMGFHWKQIYNEKLVDFIDSDLLGATATGGTEPEVSWTQSQFNLRYRTPPELEDHSVLLSTRTFVIGPEAKVPLNERRFITQSPARSDEHLMILEKLEKALSDQ